MTMSQSCMTNERSLTVLGMLHIIIHYALRETSIHLLNAKLALALYTVASHSSDPQSIEQLKILWATGAQSYSLLSSYPLPEHYFLSCNPVHILWAVLYVESLYLLMVL